MRLELRAIWWNQRFFALNRSPNILLQNWMLYRDLEVGFRVKSPRQNLDYRDLANKFDTNIVSLSYMPHMLLVGYQFCRRYHSSPTSAWLKMGQIASSRQWEAKPPILDHYYIIELLSTRLTWFFVSYRLCRPDADVTQCGVMWQFSMISVTSRDSVRLRSLKQTRVSKTIQGMSFRGVSTSITEQQHDQVEPVLTNSVTRYDYNRL